MFKSILDQLQLDKEQRTLFEILTAVLKNMPDSFSLYKVILDDRGQPVDLEYIETNRSIGGENADPKLEEGKRVTEIFPGIRDMEPDLIQIYGDVARTGKNRELEFYFEPEDRWCSVSAYAVGNDCVAVISEDTTDRKQLEESLIRQRDDFRRILDQMPDAVYIVDETRRILYTNPAMKESFGEPGDRLCHEYIHGKGEPCRWCKMDRVLKGETVQWEWTCPKTEYVFDVMEAPLRNPDGSFSKLRIARNITELTKIQERERLATALATAARSAMDTVNAMGEGVALIDLDGRILSVNPGIEALTGRNKKDLEGKNVEDLLRAFLSGEDLRIALNALPNLYDAREMHLPPVTLNSATGISIRVIPSIAFIKSPDGISKTAVLTLKDITELAEAEQDLRETSSLLERVFDNTYVLIAYLDTDFNFIRVNRAYAEADGKTPDFFPGKNHFALYPNEENRRVFENVRDTGEAFHVLEKVFEYPDHPERGKTYWDWSLQPIKDEDGNVDSLLLSLLDVTERKQAERAREASEAKYRQLVQDANSVIMRRTPDGTVTFFNEYGQRFFGYSEEEIVGKNVVGTIVPKMDSEGRSTREMMEDIGRHPERHANNENENMCKDGRRVWMQWTNRAIRDFRGDISEILCVGIDATQRKRVEGQNVQYQNRLRSLADRLAAIEEKERWRISRQLHDTVIQELSLSNIKLGAIHKSVGEAGLEKETERLDSVRTLIDGAITECRELMKELTPPLLYELGLEPALQDLAGKIRDTHGVDVEVNDDGQEKPMDNALRGFLFQSIRELLVNALKHAGNCRVLVSSTSNNGRVVISVEDNGRGFDIESLKRHSSHDGSGFGLFSIRERLEGLGGRLHIRSKPGHGTTATITVPLSPSERRREI